MEQRFTKLCDKGRISETLEVLQKQTGKKNQWPFGRIGKPELAQRDGADLQGPSCGLREPKLLFPPGAPKQDACGKRDRNLREFLSECTLRG